MTIPRFLLVLTATNLVLLVFLLAQGRPALAQGTLSVLRSRALEIIDERGQVRARLNIEPATTMPDGKTYPEAVVFRMTDPSGRIRVKLGADQDGSGLLLANDSQQPGVHLLAKGAGSSLRLLNKDGGEQVLKP
jgi:hypothetical protein